MYHDIARPFQRALAQMAYAAKQSKVKKKDVEIAQSEQGDLDAIQAAMRNGTPLYFIHTGGTTLEVAVDTANAFRLWATIADRSGLGYRGVGMYRRVGTSLFRCSPPKAN
jgi:hypothetical protein